MKPNTDKSLAQSIPEIKHKAQLKFKFSLKYKQAECIQSKYYG